MFVSMDSVCDVELLDFIQLLCQTFGFSVYKTCSEVTVYTRLLAALFYLECGLYFACGLYAQHTQKHKVFYQQ